MDIFSVKFDEWCQISITLNWVATLALILILLCIYFFPKGLFKQFKKKSIVVDEVTLGIGTAQMKLKYIPKDKEIAYKLWVELSTRKIGLLFDDENDVIIEVYNSWYEFFKIARELMKEVPATHIKYSDQLISLTEKVLNNGLRPHLTEWQAKYRKWLNENTSDRHNCTPQELQREYPFYSELVYDLKEKNLQLIKYKDLLHDIAFD